MHFEILVEDVSGKTALEFLVPKWNLLYVVHIERQESVIRIISARKATRQERTEYES